MKEDILEAWALVAFLPIVIVGFVMVVASFGILTNYLIELIYSLTKVRIDGALLLVLVWTVPIFTRFWWLNRRPERLPKKHWPMGPQDRPYD